MNETELIAKLAAAARGETGLEPAVETADLTDRVLASIRYASHPPTTRVWMMTAMATCVIAIVACFGVAQSWSTLMNPLSDLSVQQSPSVMP